MLRPTLLLSLLVAVLPTMAAEPALDALFAKSTYEKVRLSPDGQYYAALVTVDGRRALKMLNLDTHVPFTVHGPDNAEVIDFEWVSDERVVFTLADRVGGYAGLFRTGEWLAINADGSKQHYLFGWRGAESIGTHINKGVMVHAGGALIDTFANDDRYIMLAVYPWGAGDVVRDLVRVDVRSGARRKFGRMPAPRADVLIDSKGNPVIGFAPNVDGISTDVYTRTPDQDDWSSLKLPSLAGSEIQPLLLDADDNRFYATVTTRQGPDAFVLVDPKADKFEILARHDYADPAYIMQSLRAKLRPIAVGFEAETPLLSAIDDGPELKVLAALSGAFKGEHVQLIDADRAGKRYLVQVSSERRYGDYLLYDASTNKAALVGKGLPDVDSSQLVASESISLKARDGLMLHGFLTRAPKVADAPIAPMVVLVHGGPYGIYDRRQYDPEVQALATRGYSVLQINFRGSGGYGESFLEAGSKQWGGKMQDDVTDATRWAIAEGYADSKRICIMGGSYGAYAAMMGAVREPDLYQCAIGAFGIYDLAMMFEKGDIDDSEFGINYLKNRLGADKAGLRDLSPAYLADQIKADVMLVAGGMDERAPEAHSKALRKALESAGKTVKYLRAPTEAHGFSDPANHVEMMDAVLTFLKARIGAGSEPKS